MFDYHKGNYSKENKKLIDELASYNVQYPKELKNPDFKFSRDLHLRYVSDKLNLNLTNKQISKGVEIYWKSVMSNSSIYSDSKRLLNKIKKKFVIAGSDHRLKMSGRKFTYNPRFSHRQRLERTYAKLGKYFKKSQIIIGDPHDKPGKEYWKKCLNVSGLKKPSEGVIVDDSARIILSAKKFGFNVILIDREGRYKKSALKGIRIIKNFDEISEL